MPFHIITLKKNKNVKMSRCQDCKAVTPLGERLVVNESFCVRTSMQFFVNVY